MYYEKLKNKLNFALRHGYSPLLLGRTGVGKTAMVLEYVTQELSDYTFIYLDIPTLQPSDLGVMPVINKEQKSFYYALPEWGLEAIQNTKTVIFMDEINRSSSDMLNACLQIASGYICGHKLKGFVIAAGNTDNETKEFYNVIEMDAALKRRFLKIYVNQTYHEFKQYFLQKYPNSIMIQFLDTEVQQGYDSFMSTTEHGYPLSPAIIELCEKILSDNNINLKDKETMLIDNIGVNITQRIMFMLQTQLITLEQIIQGQYQTEQVPSSFIAQMLMRHLKKQKNIEALINIDKALTYAPYQQEPEHFMSLYDTLIKQIQKINIPPTIRLENISHFINFYQQTLLQ